MKKINIGIVLIVLVLALLTVYIINEEKTKEQDKEGTLAFVNEYFKVYNKYSVLEKKDRVLDKEIDEVEYNNYINQMNKDLSAYIAPEKQKSLLNQYKTRLDNQIIGKYMMYEYIKDIIRVEQYIFHEDYLSLWLKTKITVDRDNREFPILDKESKKYIGEVKKEKGEEYSYELVTLKKIDKMEYRVVYHEFMDIGKYSFENGNGTGGSQWGMIF
ncbi:MAG: hypothetical protein PHP54_02105 [Clostridia bacterium]|nr:hypothetical protein [Clostridia bacterium]